MKRSLIAFFIIPVISSACANAGEAKANALSKPENQPTSTKPNVVQMTEAPTQTPLPTDIATIEPTATQEPTTTPTETPTATPTEAVAPPEGFTSMEEAAKLGWVYEDTNGDGQKELVQHMVVENGEIVFDKASLIPLGQDEFLGSFVNKVPPMDGKQYFTKTTVWEKPHPGFKWEVFYYQVEGLEGNDVKHFLDLGVGHYGYNIAFETDNPEKNYEFPNSESEFYQRARYSTPGDPKGFVTLGLQIPIDETIESIQMATRPGEPKYTIFEQGKMDPVTAK